MARKKGSGREYQQALKTVEKAFFRLEEWANKNYEDALAVIEEQLAEGSPQTKMASAKIVMETLDKFAKSHGRNPIPADFIKDDEKSTEAGDESEGSVLNLKFGG